MTAISDARVETESNAKLTQKNKDFFFCGEKLPGNTF